MVAIAIIRIKEKESEMFRSLFDCAPSMGVD